MKKAAYCLLIALILGSCVGKPATTENSNWRTEQIDYDILIGQYTEQISSNPQNVNAYLGRARAYHAKGNKTHKLEYYYNAREDYNEVIRLEPSHWRAYHERGQVSASIAQDYRDHGAVLVAITEEMSANNDYETALNLNPNDYNFLKELERDINLLGQRYK